MICLNVSVGQGEKQAPRVMAATGKFGEKKGSTMRSAS
jgi:hypothetical protein